VDESAPATPVELTPVEETGMESDAALVEPAVEPPQYDLAPAPMDALPGDAAPTPLVASTRRGTVFDELSEPAAPTPRTGSFTVWMLVWLVAWGGVMALTLRRPINPQFDRSTSMYTTAAYNLHQHGLWPIRGGIYMARGDVHEHFYAGRPPLTAWIVTGWIQLLGNSDVIIRALPLVFTGLSLLLLYGLVRGVFGAPAALATTVIASLLPMTSYYARVVGPESFELTFILGAALGYMWWAKKGCGFGFFLLCVCVVLGCWTDWPMYVFAGLLAVTHFFRRRDLLPLRPARGVEDEDRAPGRPLVSSLFLIVLPMAMFALFLVYLKMHDAGFGDLKQRAMTNVAEHDGSQARAWFTRGYQELTGSILHPRRLRSSFIDLFTLPALLLGVLGLVFWPKWSRRLSLASGEAARRAAFRVVLCLILMQLAYSLGFPHAAQAQETWQYDLLVPVALLAAGFCTWLTLAGGTGRRFSAGLLDRIAWSVAALIPLLAIEPFLERVGGMTPMVPAVPAATQPSEIHTATLKSPPSSIRPAGVLSAATRAATSPTTKPKP
jgi:4-amino-4-deoxy-L-arabinose transferase-like glycosyltransferase